MTTEYDGVIELRSVYSKERKVRIVPTYSGRLRYYLGIERLSEEQKKTMTFYTDENSSLEITHGTTFDLNDPVDKANWDWAKFSPAIASSYDEAQMSKEAMFYVHNEAAKATQDNKVEDKLFKAMSFIREDSEQMLVKRVRILGFDMEGQPASVLRNFLYQRIKNPKTIDQVLNAYESDIAGIHLMFLTATDEGVITQNNGIFIYGSTPLGSSQQAAIETLSAPGSYSLVQAIEKEIKTRLAAKIKSEKGGSDLPKHKKPEINPVIDPLSMIDSKE